MASPGLLAQTTEDVLASLKSQFVSLQSRQDQCPIDGTYSLVAEMEKQALTAEKHYESLLAGPVTEDQRRAESRRMAQIHALMQMAASLIYYDDLFEVHEALLQRAVRNAGAQDPLELLTGERIDQEPFSGRYNYWTRDYRGLRSKDPPLRIVLEQSKRPNALKDLTFRASAECNAARRFAESLTNQLRRPIVVNYFLKYYLGEAQAAGLAVLPRYYLGDPQDRLAELFIRQRAGDFNSKSTVELRSGLSGPYLRVPVGEYTVSLDGAGQDASAALKVSQQAVEAGLAGYRLTAEASGALRADPIRQEPRRTTVGAPAFSLLDFRLGRNRERAALEGGIGGRLFQRFGSHWALQAQAQLDFRQQRDWSDLDRLLSTPLAGARRFVPREQRPLVDFSSREFQFDLGPVVRRGDWQVAALHSLLYVNRNTFDRNGLIGQWFLNAGYIFHYRERYGQVGVFATRATFDRPVVKSVQFDYNLFEETYLKVTNQFGANFQFATPWGQRTGSLEGTVSYLDTGRSNAAVGTAVRYSLPLVGKLGFMVEVGYNEGFARAGENPFRFAAGLRLGHWGGTKSDAANEAPVPVIVPRIRYETLTRVVQRGNGRPVADAGPDQLGVDWRKGPIVLDGSGSYDPDGDKLTYRWRQISGPRVELTGADSVKASFTGGNGANYVFELVVTDSKGLSSEPDTVVVTTLTINPPQITYFLADPPEIRPNQQTTLRWEVKDADSVTLRNLTAGTAAATVSPSGSMTVSVDRDTTYLLAAANASGQVSQALVVSVTPGPPPQIVYFSASALQVPPGGTSTLQWKTANADTVTLKDLRTGETWTVAAEGTRPVTPAQTTSYLLLAKNAYGEVSQTLTVQVQAGQPPEILYFTAVPGQIVAGGTAALQWKTTGADSVTLKDLRTGASWPNQPAESSKQVQPDQTTTYLLCANNAYGETCRQAQVQVLPGQPPEIVYFTAIPDQITAGGAATLKWQTRRAESATLRDLRTSQAVSVAVTGEREVRPEQSTTYLLCAANAYGEVCAQARVDVRGGPSNSVPVAIAGEDRTTSSPLVTLDGSRSYDPDGDPLTYRWRQIGGLLPANISNPNQAVTGVELTGPGFYTFELKVTDPTGASSTATVSILYRVP